MHSFFARLNVVFFYFVTCLFIAAMGCAISYYISDPTYSAHLTNARVIMRPSGRGSIDVGFVKFDADVDLSDYFNYWNTKQLFVWVHMQYKTDARPLNQMVVWDRIITDKTSAKFSISNQQNKYKLWDLSGKMRNHGVNLTLSWDIMPIVGLLHQGGGFSLPSASLSTIADVKL
eukprot:TRINITY_DN5164_c0_g1_i1.p1 TRINITY_DN5164_c0_g1~~TRINITY_DN5164_c0_g1_i1.p1  ORF type:complete len:174 (+),score=18.41 TRINITY_DN5164_c0_g1_i1:67-588(+)